MKKKETAGVKLIFITDSFNNNNNNDAQPVKVYNVSILFHIKKSLRVLKLILVLFHKKGFWKHEILSD